MKRINLQTIREKYASQKNSRLFLFRVFSLLLIFNFMAILFLSKTSFFTLLNPLAFWTDNTQDTRAGASYFFPLSIQFDTDKKNIEEFTDKVLWPAKHTKENSADVFVSQKAEALLDVLLSGINNPRAGKIPIEKNSIRKLWFYQDTLILDVKENIWSDITSADQKVFQQCVEKTMQKNITQIKKVAWVSANAANTNEE